MKRKILKIMMALMMLSSTASWTVIAKGWEPVKSEKAGVAPVVSDSELVIKAGGGIIYVTTTKSVNIQIFTILGSRIADDTLQPGAHQFVVPAHGVYIIKAGDLTCKVAV